MRTNHQRVDAMRAREPARLSVRRLVLLVSLSVGASACEEWFPIDDPDGGEDGSVTPPDAGKEDAGHDAGSDAAVVLDSATAVDAAPDANDAAQADASQEAGVDAAAPDAAVEGNELPCDVKQVLVARCQSCHSRPPTGAPFSLVTLADLRAPAYAGGLVYERVKVRIEAFTNPMPPVGSTTGALSASEKATLTNWIAAGAHGSNNVCP